MGRKINYRGHRGRAGSTGFGLLLCAFLCVLRGLNNSALAQASDLVRAHDYTVLDARINHAYRQLVHAHVFNFGGVGWANAITPEEKAFHILIGATDRITLFKRLLREANAEGQLYALYGLYLDDPETFKKQVVRINPNFELPNRWEGLAFVPKGEVRTAHGCIFYQESMRKMIASMANGEFDHDFRSTDRKLLF
jgi:hypothetical protein